MNTLTPLLRWAIVALLLHICGTQSHAQGEAAAEDTSSKTIYVSLASFFAEPLYKNGRKGAEIDQTTLLANKKELFLDVYSAKHLDPELRQIAEDLEAADDRLQQRIEVFEMLLEKSDTTLTALLRGIYCGATGQFDSALQHAVSEADLDQNKRSAGRLLLQAKDNFEAARLMLPRVARRLAGPATSGPIFKATIFEAWGRPADLLELDNQSHRTLHNCTLVVALNGNSGETRKTVFYTDVWPDGNATVEAALPPGIKFLDGHLGRSTVSNIDTATITLYCDELSSEPMVSKNNDYRDEWISTLLRGLTARSSYQPFKKGTIWDDQRSVSLSFEGQGLVYLPPGAVTISLKNGQLGVTRRWTFPQWQEKTTKWFEFKDIDWEATEWSVTFGFNDTTVTRTYRWTKTR